MSAALSPATPPVAQLCGRCRIVQDVEGIVHEDSPGPKGYSIYSPYKEILRVDDKWPNLPVLARSASDGCGLCQLLRRCVSEAEPRDQFEGKVHIDLFRTTTMKGTRPHIIYYFEALVYAKGKQLKDGTVLVTQTTFLACSDGGVDIELLDIKEHFHQAPLSDVLSNRAIGFMRKSIDHCVEQCHPWRPSDFLPTRLIRIVTGNETGSKLQLVRSAELDGKIKYASLSYCWGSQEDAAHQPTTNSMNVKARMTGFDPDEMSPVVRDAVKVCQLLELEYLWVDALCILQGQDVKDREDWAKESRTMVDVYRNAYVTLCIASTTSCRQSFLAPRTIKDGIRVPITASGSESAPATFYDIIPYDGEFDSQDMSRYAGEVSRSQWYSRGWVWQEMKFSPRLLIFAPTFVFFECAATQRCENGFFTTFSEKTERRVGGAAQQILEKRPFDFWQIAVESFSSKQLTFERDKLPALAGLTSEVARITGGCYMAGLWRENIHKDLFFEVKERERSIMDRIKTLSAEAYAGGPSWSWSAFSKPVEYLSLLHYDFGNSPPPGWKLECESLNYSDSKVATSIDGCFRADGGPQTHALQLKTRVIPLAGLIDQFAHMGSRHQLLKKILGTHSAGLTKVCGCAWHWDVEHIEIPPRAEEDVLLVLISSCLQPRDSVPDAYGLIVYPATKSLSRGVGTAQAYYRMGVFYSQNPAYVRPVTAGGMAMTEGWETREVVVI